MKKLLTILLLASSCTDEKEMKRMEDEQRRADSIMVENKRIDRLQSHYFSTAIKHADTAHLYFDKYMATGDWKYVKIRCDYVDEYCRNVDSFCKYQSIMIANLTTPTP